MSTRCCRTGCSWNTRTARWGSWRFEKPKQEELEKLASALARRTLRQLSKKGALETELLDDDALAETCARGVQARLPFSREPKREADEDLCGERLCANAEGFSLEASRRVHEHDREGLRRLCRYMARPPLALTRLSKREDGKLLYRLKRKKKNGATEVVLSPMELMRRLAALVPHRKTKMITYRGVFASNARLRKKIVPGVEDGTGIETEVREDGGTSAEAGPREGSGAAPFVKAPEPCERYLPWADLMARVHETDVLECGKCGGRMKVTAFVTDKAEAREILTRLGLASTKPMRAPSRDPPPKRLFEEPPGFYPDEPWTDEVGSV